jgi:murein DD-endopeptidase MepM/ murein hydrolase activator NlpD
MNKEKYSTILEKYSDFLKRYGVYLLIIFFIFAVSLNYFLGKESNPVVEFDPGSIPVVDVALEDSTSDVEQELFYPEKEASSQEAELNNNTEISAQKVKKVPDEPPVEEVVQETGEAEAINLMHEEAVANEANEKAENIEQSEKLSTSLENLTWPVEGKVIKNYGLSYSEVYGDYRLYPGIDIEAKSETDISSAAAGKVILVEKTGENFTIEIDHGQELVTHYSQLSQALVKIGQSVKAGEKIGQAGTYLHFRIKQNGRWVDPVDKLPGE